MVRASGLREILDGNYEWLLVHEDGRSFALTRPEIGLFERNGDGTVLEFLDDKGVQSRLLTRYSLCDDQISLDIVDTLDGSLESIGLVPRVSAAQLSTEVEIARLERANEIGRLITEHESGIKLGRVALNKENGRMAQFTFDLTDKTPMAAITDVTGSMTVEAMFTAAMVWLEKLGERKKKAILDIWVVCEKRQAKNAQKLLALLSDRCKAKITVFEVIRTSEPLHLRRLPGKKMRELWREKATKLKLHQDPPSSELAEAIIALAEEIDVIYSNNGTTLRFNGLPFARIRTLKETERSWFGIGRDRRPLTRENWKDLEELVAELKRSRAHTTGNKRHEYYRGYPEAWLESILKRKISLLDANLILSPIYNQFRSSNDKIDLLALRRDGRLVIVELKTQPDREMVFQAADYWRKIELQRQRGILAAADLFEGREIMDKPALVYLAAPAWSFHRDFEFFAAAVSPDIELWRFELHEAWREKVKVLVRHSYSDSPR